jgi:hypothetical protein
MGTAVAIRGLFWFDESIHQWLAIEQAKAPESVKRAANLWNEKTYTVAKGTEVTAYRYALDPLHYFPAELFCQWNTFNTALSVILVIDEESGQLVAACCDHPEMQGGWSDEEKFGVDPIPLIANLLSAELAQRRRDNDLREFRRSVLPGAGKPRGGELGDTERARRLAVLQAHTRGRQSS